MTKFQKVQGNYMNTKILQDFIKMLIKMLRKIPPDEVIDYLESFLEEDNKKEKPDRPK